MATNILANGVGAANSADLVVTEPTLVALKSASDPVPSGATVIVYLKDDASVYRRIGTLTSGKPSMLIAGPGTYRFSRLANSRNCGVYSG